jgi:hypothetical protein
MPNGFASGANWVASDPTSVGLARNTSISVQPMLVCDHYKLNSSPSPAGNLTLSRPVAVAVTSVSQNSATAGQTLTLPFHGSGLKSGLGVHFQSADGIDIERGQPTSDTELQVEIKVSATAAATARTITLQHGRQSFNVPGVFTVKSTSESGSLIGRGLMQGLGTRSFSPTQASQGQIFTLSVFGSGLLPSQILQLDPAEGVEVGPAKAISGLQLDYSLKISDKATIGVRKLALQLRAERTPLSGQLTIGARRLITLTSSQACL